MTEQQRRVKRTEKNQRNKNKKNEKNRKEPKEPKGTTKETKMMLSLASSSIDQSKSYELNIKKDSQEHFEKKFERKYFLILLYFCT